MIHIAMFLLLAAQAAETPAGRAADVDPLAALSGHWRIVDSVTGEVRLDCDGAQIFTVAPDRKTVLLTEKGADDWSIRYIVLHGERNRILMFIENEDRMTESGDPLLWWAYFDGPDRFTWRQYHWSPNSRTVAEWRRCPPA